MGTLYLDISDEVKLNWKIQRDIEARKPDFDAYIAPQKEFSDVVIQVLPTQLDEGDKKTLRVKLIQSTGIDDFDPVYFMDEGSTISWKPAPSKLASPAPGLKLAYGPDTYFDKEVQVVEMDGSFDNIKELVCVEGQLKNTAAKYFGELTESMLKLADAPGSNNGTGLMQTLAAFAIRSLYEKKAAAAPARVEEKEAAEATA